MTPFITWHGHDLPLCARSDSDPATQWPELPLTDICTTLAHIPRFTAAQRQVLPTKDRAHNNVPRITSQRPWSVAQHLLLCGLLAKQQQSSNHTIAAALVHDLHEAFLGDIISPVVWALPPDAQKAISQLKAEVDGQIIWANPDSPQAVCLRAMPFGNYKQIDNMALVLERSTFMRWKPDNLPWVFKFMGEGKLSTIITVASSQDFATLRNYTPQETADELVRVIIGAAAQLDG